MRRALAELRMNQAEWERSRAEAEQLQEKVEKSQGEIYRLKAKLENAQSEKENLQVSHFCPPPPSANQAGNSISGCAPPQICFSRFAGRIRTVSGQRVAAARRAGQGRLRRGESARRAGTVSKHAGQIAAAAGKDSARIRQGPERGGSTPRASG